VSSFSGLQLDPTQESDPLKTAWERQLREQSLVNNIPKEVLNSATRIIGWATLDFLLYGGRGLLNG